MLAVLWLWSMRKQQPTLYNFSCFCPLADPASMADVQKKSPVLAASHTRDQRGAQPKTSGKSQKEETQITLNYPCLAVDTSFISETVWILCSSSHSSIWEENTLVKVINSLFYKLKVSFVFSAGLIHCVIVHRDGFLIQCIPFYCLSLSMKHLFYYGSQHYEKWV